jgi:hypothetical protein
MERTIQHHVCFRLHAHSSMGDDSWPSSLGLRLGSTQAAALSELLVVFACGEESAALAFGHLADAKAAECARAALALVVEEEMVHDRLLRQLRGALPVPGHDRELRMAQLRFYRNIGYLNVGQHLAAIAALDSAVCIILSAVLQHGRPLASEPTVRSIFARIRYEESRHVRLSRGLATVLTPRTAAREVAAFARLGLVEILARRADALERLEIDPDRLFMRLAKLPSGLLT